MVSSLKSPERNVGSLLRRVGLRSAHSTSRHRNVQGGAARAVVLGAGDGLVTNVSLVLGIAGAGSSDEAVVRLVGVAGLLAGAFSMAAGELVSVRAQAELVQRELAVESDELATQPAAEQAELAGMYRARGVPDDDARTVARILSANHDLALDTHARLELGIDPGQQASASVAAVSSFFAFAVGAIIPLLPWFFAKGLTAVLVSMALGAAGAIVLGGLIGLSTGRGVARTAARQLAAVIVAAGITYAVGYVLGVGTS